MSPGSELGSGHLKPPPECDETQDVQTARSDVKPDWFGTRSSFNQIPSLLFCVFFFLENQMF